MRFLVSPVEILGTERVEAVRRQNKLCKSADGTLRPRPTDETEVIGRAGLPLDGYHGVTLPDALDEVMGSSQRRGRVIERTAPSAQEYVVGWIKRTTDHRPNGGRFGDSQRLLEDASAERLLRAATVARRVRLARRRQIRVVTFEDGGGSTRSSGSAARQSATSASVRMLRICWRWPTTPRANSQLTTPCRGRSQRAPGRTRRRAANALRQNQQPIGAR